MGSITFQKMLGGALFALILVKGAELLGDALVPHQPGPAGRHHAAAPPRPAVLKPGIPATAPPEAEPEKPIAALLANANPDAGAEVARKCASCHSFDEGGPNRVGPNLHGVVGAPKAARPGFAYSEPLKAKGGAWTYEDLNAFLTRPGGFIPGTKMAFAGLSNGEDRANVIAYLRRQSPAAPPLPAPQAPPR